MPWLAIEPPAALAIALAHVARSLAVTRPGGRALPPLRDMGGAAAPILGDWEKLEPLSSKGAILLLPPHLRGL